MELDRFGRPYKITVSKEASWEWGYTARAHTQEGMLWCSGRGRTEDEALRVLDLCLRDCERGRRLEIAIRQAVVAEQLAARAKREAAEARRRLKEAREAEAQAKARLEGAQQLAGTLR